MATETASTSIGTRALDHAAARIEGGDVEAGIALTFAHLYELRRSAPTEAWREALVPECRRHPLMRLLQQDPMTARGFAKPRGYAGDAELLDFIYGPEDGRAPAALRTASELGRRVHAEVVRAPAAAAVRARRRMVCEKLNALAARRPGLHVLSLACGHLREAERCEAVRSGRVGRFVAVDQDDASLAVVARELAPLGVEPVAASVRDLLRGRVELGTFDFVYSAGLYDYLPMPTAQELTRRLFDMLNPGGHLLLANFLPGISSAGYMEAYMDWWLLYRTKAELLQLTDRVPECELATTALYVEESQNVGFVELERRWPCSPSMGY